MREGRRCAGGLEGLHHQGGFVGVEDGGEADHAVLQGLFAEEAAVVEAVGGGEVVIDDLADLAAEALELAAGAVLGELEEAVLVLRSGDAGEGADLGVGQLAAAERFIHMGELAQRAGDADALAGGDGVEADAPGEPVGTAEGALALPCTRLVEGADAGEEMVGGGVEASGGAGDLVAERPAIGRDLRDE
jgi:hypothetical protein